jgi:hypothetical protein
VLVGCEGLPGLLPTILMAKEWEEGSHSLRILLAALFIVSRARARLGKSFGKWGYERRSLRERPRSVPLTAL